MCFKVKMLFDKALNEFREGFALFDFRIKITSTVFLSILTRDRDRTVTVQ
jgi:hypothetical protein